MLSLPDPPTTGGNWKPGNEAGTTETRPETGPAPGTTDRGRKAGNHDHTRNRTEAGRDHWTRGPTEGGHHQRARPHPGRTRGPTESWTPSERANAGRISRPLRESTRPEGVTRSEARRAEASPERDQTQSQPRRPSRDQTQSSPGSPERDQSHDTRPRPSPDQSTGSQRATQQQKPPTTARKDPSSRGSPPRVHSYNRKRRRPDQKQTSTKAAPPRSDQTGNPEECRA